MNLVEYANPDIIVGTETWLGLAYTIVSLHHQAARTYIARRDQMDMVESIISKINIHCDELYISRESELIALSVGRGNNRPLTIAGFYRPPSSNQDQAERACSEIQRCSSQAEKTN